jgi:hypothetical protein
MPDHTNAYVADAEEIFSDFRKRLKKDKEFKELDPEKCLEFYQKRNENFSMTFPITLRYMILLKQYSTKAFVRFIKKLETAPYKSELEYCERQADYVKYLHMELSNTHNMQEAQKIWQKTYDMLAKEVQMFKDANEKVKKKLEKNNNANNIEKREELKKALGL